MNYFIYFFQHYPLPRLGDEFQKSPNYVFKLYIYIYVMLHTTLQPDTATDAPRNDLKLLTFPLTPLRVEF